MKLQFLVLPEGITYNCKKDECRTLRVNSVFRCIADVAGISANEKSGGNTVNCIPSALVDSSNELSNHLMEFFKQIYTLKRLFKFCP